jgi:hypothetical protein
MPRGVISSQAARRFTGVNAQLPLAYPPRCPFRGVPRRRHGSLLTRRWREPDSSLGSTWQRQSAVAAARRCGVTFASLERPPMGNKRVYETFDAALARFR